MQTYSFPLAQNLPLEQHHFLFLQSPFSDFVRVAFFFFFLGPISFFFGLSLSGNLLHFSFVGYNDTPLTDETPPFGFL